MNPNQPPATPGTGGTTTPPNPANTGSVSDIPEQGFGFADEQPALPPVARPAAPVPAAAPRPAPVLSAPPRPVVPQPVTSPVPAQPAAPALPTQATPVAVPVPQPALAPQPTPATPPKTVMPPQRVPAVPTLTQPQAVAPQAAPTPQPVAVPQSTPTPTPQPVPAQPTPTPRPTAYAAATANLAPNEPFDPAKVQVTATSTPVNPITASYSPQPVTHLPDDIANRIGEKPMQNSGDILRQIKHGLDGSRIKGILSFVVFIVSIFVAAFMINQFVFQSYYVEGTSMTPTLQNDDRLIISKVERTWASIQGKPYIPERGQIVVLDSSIVGLNGQHEQLIKRVIGLPGDRIHIEAGTVIITNSQHPDGYDVTKDLGLTNLQATFSEEPLDLTIPEGHVYVMGDNREQGGSYDSRSFGPIEGNQIQGRLWGRVLPLNKAQLY